MTFIEIQNYLKKTLRALPYNEIHETDPEVFRVDIMEDTRLGQILYVTFSYKSRSGDLVTSSTSLDVKGEKLAGPYVPTNYQERIDGKIVLVRSSMVQLEDVAEEQLHSYKFI